MLENNICDCIEYKIFKEFKSIRMQTRDSRSTSWFLLDEIIEQETGKSRLKRQQND